MKNWLSREPLDDLEHNLKLQERMMNDLAQSQGEYHSFKSNLGDIPVERPDMVNQPPHYTYAGKIECIEYIKDFLSKDEYEGFLRGNIAKYLHRFRYKNGLEDVKKAQWYLSKLIENLEE